MRRRVRPDFAREASPSGIFLVGFMGAGKTTAGRALAQQLNWLFEDLDERIERREHRTVPDIFRNSGESEFRRAEYSALRDVIEELRAGVVKVVALGGGAFAQDSNVALLKAASVPTVFLDAPVEELWRRCCRQTNTERPLLRSIDQFRELYEARRASYLHASYRIQTGGRAQDEIAAEIVETLGLKKIEIRAQQGEIE